MNLTVPERINLINLLPTKGDFLTLRIIFEAKDALDFDEVERKRIELTPDGSGRVSWNPSAASEVDVVLARPAIDVIVIELNKLNEAKQLTVDQFSLYEKFVLGDANA